MSDLAALLSHWIYFRIALCWVLTGEIPMLVHKATAETELTLLLVANFVLHNEIAKIAH